MSRMTGWRRHGHPRALAAVVLFLSGLLLIVSSPALADPPVAKNVIDKPTHIAPVPRGIPDLTPYHEFDPPKSPLFDINRLTVSGDMRVRPEIRTNSNFGVSQGAALTGGGFDNAAGRAPGHNDFYVQQWMRLGINYALSPDVDFFVQPQWAKNWGAASTVGTNGAGCPAGGTICANDPFNNGQADSLFLRQAFMMIRNLGVQGLNLKVGRQLVVMGNHRLFGHFDWANTGYSHDGITLQYSQPLYEIWAGWLMPMDTEFNAFGIQSSSFGVMPQGAPTSNFARAGYQSDLFFARVALKPVAGLSIEPLWVWQRNGTPQIGGFPTGASAPGAPGLGAASTANTMLAAHANGQTRHTVGARIGLRQGIFDGHVEGYHQFGSMDIGATGQRAHINAYAFAAEGGVTLPFAWQPRIGLEFNMASGDDKASTCNVNTGVGCGTANTFENLYPTNHIIMGYADIMAWRNMIAYSASFQFKPSSAQHVEFRYWNFHKQSTGDCWYRAAQNCYYTANNGSSMLAQELDGIYTLFLKDNKVAWQLGGSYIFAGEFLDRQAGAGNSPVNQVWAYTQLHVNF